MAATYDTYEALLDSDVHLAWREGGMHFENQSEVHRTLQRIAKRLDELNVDYALVGGMAMFFHGFRRFTEDVDLLVTREGLARIHAELEGLGYVRLFSGSKALRDAQSRVKIDFLLAGDYPGEGKPGPVAFPSPESVIIESDGLKLIELHRLVELKLASGQSSNRQRDLVDVQDLIQHLDLPLDLKDKVDPSLRDEYENRWKLAQQSKADDY